MLADSSQDFVIANHLLEHLPDPIGALKEWYRVLRAGGTLFLGKLTGTAIQIVFVRHVATLRLGFTQSPVLLPALHAD
jgi:ubiquinone/menaquinone biosynthesis C-methylase UbiE